MSYPLTPIALAIPIALSGASADAEVVVELPEVRVQSEWLSRSVGTLQGDALVAARAATSDTASLLTDVPGVNVFSAGGVSGLPVIHGLADDRLRLKVDGIDLVASCPNHMNPALSYLDPSQVAKLTVYAGIAPVSAGGDSIGGTIVAESLPPAFAQPGQAPLVTGEMGSYYRSNADARGANLATTFATEAFSASYVGAIAKADDYRAADTFKKPYATNPVMPVIASTVVGSTAYATQNHALNLAWRDSLNLIEAKFGHQEVPYQLYPNQRMDMLGNHENRVNLHYLSQKDWGALDVRVYSEWVNHTMDFGPDRQYWYASMGSSNYNIAGMPMATHSRTVGATVKADVELGAAQLLRIGAETQAYRLDDRWPAVANSTMMGPNPFLNINGGQRDRQALFAELESQWPLDWVTLAGARVERVTTDAGAVQGYNGSSYDPSVFNGQAHRKTDVNLDLTALARHTPNAYQSYEFGVAQKTRSPNLYERYSWSSNTMAAIMNNFVGDGNGYLGDPNLKPEVARTVSVVADWHSADRTAQLKLAPFVTYVSDYVDAVPYATLSPNAFNVLKYANQNARLVGADLSGQLPLGANGLGQWSAKGVVNYTYGKNLDTGSGLYNVMPLNGKFVLQQRQGAWTHALELVAVAAKTHVATVRNEIQTGGYSLVNWRGSYTVQKLRVDFGVENLFNRFYSLPLGGAYLGEGKTMALSGVPYGVAVPGMGRSLYVGVNYRF